MEDAQQHGSGVQRASQTTSGSNKPRLLPGQPFGYGVNDDDQPFSNNLEMAMLSILFCPLIGPIAVYKSLQCRSMKKQNKIHEAHVASIVSRRYAFSGMVLGIFFWILYLAIYVLKLSK